MPNTNNRITKSTINIDVLKQTNTNCNLFDLIIYVLSNSNQILIERPRDHKIWETSAYSIGEFIRVKKIKTDWVKHIDGSFTKFNEDELYHIVPLNNEFGYYKIKHSITMHMQNYRVIRELKNSNFKLTKKVRSKKLNQFNLTFHATVPIWPLWALVSSRLSSKGGFVGQEDLYHLQKLFMKIGDDIYRFPYGNVNGNDKVCIGHNNKGNFTSVEDIWFNWITTTFNFDYKHNLKPNMLFTDNQRGENKRLIPVTYDLDYINMLLHTNNPLKVSLIDAMFYMANIEDIREIDYSKIFFKHPGLPEKVDSND